MAVVLMSGLNDWKKVLQNGKTPNKFYEHLTRLVQTFRSKVARPNATTTRAERYLRSILSPVACLSSPLPLLFLPPSPCPSLSLFRLLLPPAYSSLSSLLNGG